MDGAQPAKSSSAIPPAEAEASPHATENTPDTDPLEASRSTSGADANASHAAQKVFDTVELLEMILLNVPLFDLFVIQRTNKTFKGTIHGSIELRRAMFLDHVSTPSIQWSPILNLSVFKPQGRGCFIRDASMFRTVFEVLKLSYFPRPLLNQQPARIWDGGNDMKAWFGSTDLNSRSYEEETGFQVSERYLPLNEKVKESWRSTVILHGHIEEILVSSRLHSAYRLNEPLDDELWMGTYIRMGCDSTLGDLFDWLDGLKLLRGDFCVAESWIKQYPRM